jgi:hypothetical protein
VVVVVEVPLPGGEPVQQLGLEFRELPGNVAEARTLQRKVSAIVMGEPDDPGKGLVPAEIIIAGVPPRVLAHGWSFFYRGPKRPSPTLLPGKKANGPALRNLIGTARQVRSTLVR